MVHHFYKVSVLKKLLSYLVPVTVASSSGSQNRFLEFILYRNQWQLATEEALYSDGNRYQPFRIAFKHIPKETLSHVSECLVLGTGLGSIVQILSEKYKACPRFTLVEYDEQILKWALENLSAMGIGKLNPYCENAEEFVKREKGKYDLICVDIFKGREVPSLFIEEEFLMNSRRLLKPGGIWIMNYIINDDQEAARFFRNIKRIFINLEIIEKDQNRIVIAS